MVGFVLVYFGVYGVFVWIGLIYVWVLLQGCWLVLVRTCVLYDCWFVWLFCFSWFVGFGFVGLGLFGVFILL